MCVCVGMGGGGDSLSSNGKTEDRWQTTIPLAAASADSLLKICWHSASSSLSRLESRSGDAELSTSSFSASSFSARHTASLWAGPMLKNCAGWKEVTLSLVFLFAFNFCSCPDKTVHISNLFYVHTHTHMQIYSILCSFFLSLSLSLTHTHKCTHTHEHTDINTQT